MAKLVSIRRLILQLICILPDCGMPFIYNAEDAAVLIKTISKEKGSPMHKSHSASVVILNEKINSELNDSTSSLFSTAAAKLSYVLSGHITEHFR